MTVYVNIFSNVSACDGDISSIDRIRKISVEIDHNASWDMPEGLSADEERGVTEVMEAWIEQKFDPSDFGPDPDEYYDTRNERRSA